MIYQPYYSQLTQPQPQPQPYSSGITWVQGEAGAKSYQVAPNTSVQLWDSEAQTIYIKSADASGIPSIKIIDYTFRDNTRSNTSDSILSDYATQSDINTLREEINALKSKLERLGDNRGKRNKLNDNNNNNRSDR